VSQDSSLVTSGFLASTIALETGEDGVTSEALGTARHRLRRRLRAVEGIMGEWADDPDCVGRIEPVLEKLEPDEGHPGRSKADRGEQGDQEAPPDHHLLRAIILCWIAVIDGDGDGLMVWPAASHAVAHAVGGDPLERAAATVRRMIAVWRQGGGAETGLLERDLVAERFARLARWLAADPTRLPRLRQMAGRLHMPELLSAGIYSRVILAMSPAQAAQTLKFTAREQKAAWEKILQAM
jgi:hypothetical protein